MSEPAVSERLSFGAANGRPRVACISMQKDERMLLRPWLAYHSYLFGHHNIFVFDNGSQDEAVRATLRHYVSRGVNVDWTKSSRADYEAKGDVIGRRMRSLDEIGSYDFLIPLDCDEFIVLKDIDGFICDRDRILTYLASLTEEKRVLRFPFHLANHPIEPDLYHYFSFFKVFFARGTFESVDHGNHFGRSNKSSRTHDTRLVHLHFHYKSFDTLISQAKRSWVGTVNVEQDLTGYSGPSVHLVQYFKMTKPEYYQSFLSQVHFHIREFRELLETLGAPISLEKDPEAELYRITWPHQLPSPLASTGALVLIPKRENDGRTSHSVELFNEWDYVRANSDIVRPGIDPISHFCSFGWKEGRPLRPAVAEVATASSAPAPRRTGLNDGITEQLVASYIAGRGPVAPGADGIRCIEFGHFTPQRNGWLIVDVTGGKGALQLDLEHSFEIQNASFDYAYSDDVIEHVPYRAGKKLLSEIHRILKPGGILRLCTASLRFLLRLFSEDRTELENSYIEWATRNYAPDSPVPSPCFVLNNFMRAWGHAFIYDAETLIQLLETVGFHNIKQCKISQSEHSPLRDLESVSRLPTDYAELETMVFEASRLP